MSLCNFSQVHRFAYSPQAYKRKNIMQTTQSTKNPTYKETSSCICHKASLTVEAAVVIPVVAAFFASLLFFFRVIQVQAIVEEALLYAGRKTAVEGSVVEDDAVLYTSAKGFMMYALKDEQIIARYVEQGSLGVVLLGSTFDEDRITLSVHYKVRLPIVFFEIDGITLWNRATFRKWVGDNPKGESEEGDWVYITETGSVYHATSACRVLNLRISAASLQEINEVRGLNGQKYYACSQCAESYANAQKVYYTDYGTLYHYRMDCQYIKRTVEKVLLSEVDEKTPCSYCYGN